MVFFPCWCFTGSTFPAGASHGLLSLLVLHRVYFSCWCFTWSSFPAGASQGLLFPAGASHGLLSLLVLHRVYFSCWCFTWSSFPAGASQISYFKILPRQATKWPPIMDISRAITPSFPQSYLELRAKLICSKHP